MSKQAIGFIIIGAIIAQIYVGGIVLLSLMMYAVHGSFTDQFGRLHEGMPIYVMSALLIITILLKIKHHVTQHKIYHVSCIISSVLLAELVIVNGYLLVFGL